MDIKDLIDRLEPQQSTTADAEPSLDLLLMSATSAAVSLKRIADALERSNEIWSGFSYHGRLGVRTLPA